MGKSVTVVASATSDSTIANLVFLIDGQRSCQLAGSSGSCDFRLTNGPHTLTVSATDATGDVGSASVLVRSIRSRG